jgi:predicted lipoprotein with Yx(FWY)xxD motif
MAHGRLVRSVAAAVATALLALVLAACGSDDGSSSTSASTATNASGGAATVGLADNSDLGGILVDRQGRTIYLFRKDAGGKSACSGGCAAAWPPVRAAGKPTVGSGLTAAKVSTITRTDGRPQVVYNGHPLYTYTADQQPGDTNGQGVTAFGAPWYALTAAGAMVTGTGSGSGSNY